MGRLWLSQSGNRFGCVPCVQGFFYIRTGDLVPQDAIDRHFEVNKRCGRRLQVCRSRALGWARRCMHLLSEYACTICMPYVPLCHTIFIFRLRALMQVLVKETCCPMSRYFDVPEEVLAKLPVVDWADPNGRLGHGDGNYTTGVKL